MKKRTAGTSKKVYWQPTLKHYIGGKVSCVNFNRPRYLFLQPVSVQTTLHHFFKRDSQGSRVVERNVDQASLQCSSLKSSFQSQSTSKTSDCRKRKSLSLRKKQYISENHGVGSDAPSSYDISLKNSSNKRSKPHSPERLKEISNHCVTSSGVYDNDSPAHGGQKSLSADDNSVSLSSTPLPLDTVTSPEIVCTLGEDISLSDFLSNSFKFSTENVINQYLVLEVVPQTDAEVGKDGRLIFEFHPCVLCMCNFRHKPGLLLKLFHQKARIEKLCYLRDEW